MIVFFSAKEVNPMIVILIEIIVNKILLSRYSLSITNQFTQIYKNFSDSRPKKSFRKKKLPHLKLIEGSIIILLHKAAILKKDHDRHAAIGQREEIERMEIPVRKGKAVTAVAEK